MGRLQIRIEDSERAWLEQQALATGLSIDELIRMAIRDYRRVFEERVEALDSTRGLWRKGDGLSYQRSLRREW